MRIGEGISTRKTSVALLAAAASAVALPSMAQAQVSGAQIAEVSAALKPVPDTDPAQLNNESQAVARHLAWRVLQADKQFPKNDKDQFTDAPRRTTLDDSLRMRSVMIRSHGSDTGLYGLHTIIKLQKNANGKKVLLPRNVQEVNIIAENTKLRYALGMTTLNTNSGWMYVGERTPAQPASDEVSVGPDVHFDAVTNPVQLPDRQITSKEIQVFAAEMDNRIDAAVERQPFGPLWLPLTSNTPVETISQ